tara:strand:- start:2154 stop:3392 length:1239 start_codon:yes stop_codon:yes gene_type:complete
MAKITLDDITSSYASTSLFQANFTAIETQFNDKVLYRNNPTGEANQMENNLDMNSNSILNAGVVNATGLTLGGTQVVPTGTTSLPATALTYDNTASGLAAVDVQAAIDELDSNQDSKNLLINGNFDIWQRGASFTGNGYTADRWAQFSNTPFNVTRVASTPADSTILNTRHILRVNSITSGEAFADLYQRIEGLSQFFGKEVTLSFRCNNAGTGSTIKILAKTSIDGTTFSSNIVESNITVNPGWGDEHSITFTVPEDAGVIIGDNSLLQITFNVDGLTDVYLANVKLEVGSAPTKFSTQGSSIGEELALCKRFYQSLASTSGGGISSASISNGRVHVSQQLTVTMRTNPALSFSDVVGNTSKFTGVAGDNQAFSGGTVNVISPNTIAINAIVGAPNFNGFVYCNVVLDAEL